MNADVANLQLNADVAYLFRPLGLFFTDKVPQYRQWTCLLEHSPVCSFILIINESTADGDWKALGQRGADVSNLVELLAHLSSASLSGQLDFSIPIELT